MIGCAFVEYLSVLLGPSRTPFESFPTPWSPFADSSLTPLTDTLAPLVEVFSPFPTFQLRPSPPPESTGSGALPLLRPGPCGSCRQGGRLQPRRETERQPKGQHAGGTPALPGCRPDGEVGGIRRATSLKAGLSPLGNPRLPASRAPAPHDGADPSRRTINGTSM